ncbi:von Willebrand factor A domain-containing protein 5A-like [Mizuhopecten yessoensis]|uniref:von Willebrand factor A domain-containing protein 5A n=1 Tax=Mizuhopecten yessoensis TaxID=6573 RepID=A0A210Q434_MIZYE|nr:von Willebrand factor A domain-containing protein 5A-like [Mizuhopecten yessoensis]OWF43481.1 von Willebrand factor A domain-containing protein 5A [Mizuhopecten yessoensis]
MRWGLSCLKTGAAVPLKEVQNVALIGASLVHVDSNLQYLNETNDPIEANFTFPLDTGSAVYRFEAEIDSRLIVAECQEKSQARDTYQQAVSIGQTAVLLEEHDDTDDIFVCRLGNLPPNEKALLKICYVSELPHDPNGALRFTLPTVLNPRYGAEHNTGPVNTRTDVVCINPGSYAMSLDITVQSQQKISSIVSEKDQLQLSPGNNDHVWKASIRFNGGTQLDHDISIMILYQDMHQPQAILERGTRSPDKGMLNMDVLMLSFYPEIDSKFTRTCGEFIFIIDRSGSMANDNRIESARDTLLLMIKSLPVGCFFNVYSFGNYFHILFDKDSACSVQYNEQSMTYALDYVQKMEADMGGTEILKPLEDMYSKPCLPGHPRQVILLTDGEVWNVTDCLNLVRRNAQTTRMFSVGIGEGVSTALVKGLAKAGKGRAEFVKGNDRLQTKVVSLLKSAMQSVVTNIQVDLELPPEVTGSIVPNDCPSLFSGEEFIMYAVLKGSESMESIQGNIILRGVIENQIFEHKLAFQGQHQQQNLDTSLPVHRLTAKALIQELEDEESATRDMNRKATTDNQNKIVLVSTATNVISKYTAFVGVDKLSKVLLPQGVVERRTHQGGWFGASSGGGGFGASSGGGGMFGASSGRSGMFGASVTGGPSYGLFGCKPSPQFGSSNRHGGITQAMFGSKPIDNARCFGGMFGAAASKSKVIIGSSGNIASNLFAKPAPTSSTFGAPQQTFAGFGGSLQSSASFGAQQQNCGSSGGLMFGRGTPLQNSAPQPLSEKTKLVLMQGFDGSWALSDEFANFLGTTSEGLQQSSQIQNLNAWATCLALAWLHLKESLNKEEWSLIESKALQWLQLQGFTDEDMKNLFAHAQNQIKNM